MDATSPVTHAHFPWPAFGPSWLSLASEHLGKLWPCKAGEPGNWSLGNKVPAFEMQARKGLGRSLGKGPGKPILAGVPQPLLHGDSLHLVMTCGLEFELE